MNGQEQIISMRRAGRRPSTVFLNDFPCPTDWAALGDHPTIDVHGEQPEWLDLRFLVGLTVSISAATEKRGRRFMDACKKAGAAVVGAGSNEFKDGRFQAVWSDVWRKEA